MNQPSDRKPCGCLKTVECTHKNPAPTPSSAPSKEAYEAMAANIVNEGFKGPEVEFDANKFLREPPQVEVTLAERGSRYGDFSDNAELSQCLEQACKNHAGYGNLTTLHREALKFIFQKISRIVNGDPNYADNWHDIQGYAKLVEDRLPKEGK